MPSDFTFMWNIINKIEILIDSENKLMGDKGEGVGRVDEKGERINNCKLTVTKQSWGCKMPHREYSQYYCTRLTGGLFCKLYKCITTMPYSKLI